MFSEANKPHYLSTYSEPETENYDGWGERKDVANSFEDFWSFCYVEMFMIVFAFFADVSQFKVGQYPWMEAEAL